MQSKDQRKHQVFSVRAVAVCLLVLGIIVSTATIGLAQAGPTGSLSGVVQDASGASIGGAKVSATSAETGFSRTTTADAEGRWTLSVLPTGNYKVTVEAATFKRAVANATVEAAVPRLLDVKLEVGDLTVEVQITDAAPLVTPTTATTFRQLNAEELTKVPTSTRSFTHLLSAEAGVSSDLPPVLTQAHLHKSVW